MLYHEAKCHVLFKLHSSTRVWFGIVGEMYEATRAFTCAGSIKKIISGSKYLITLNDNIWTIMEV